MFEILKDRYNPIFRYVDSTEHQKWFRLRLVDSTKLTQPIDTSDSINNYDYNTFYGYIFNNAPLHLIFLVPRDNIENCYLDKTKVRMFLDPTTWIDTQRRYDHIIQFYDSAPPEYPTLESYIQHVRDKDGIEITMTKDTIVPYRWLYIHKPPPK